MNQKLIMDNWRRFTGEKKEPELINEGIWTPNHYCVHHGGVQLNGTTQMAEAVGHNYDDKLGRVTHYNMKLKDGTILENVAAEDIQVTNASLAEGHTHQRDDDPGETPEPEEEAPIEDEFTELQVMSDEDLQRLAAALEDAAQDWYGDEDPYDAGY